MPSRRINTSRPSKITSGGPTTTVDPFVDAFSLEIQAADSNATPTDAGTYAMTLLQADTAGAQTDAAELSFPSGVWGETNAAPSEGQSFAVEVWLDNSAGTGVSNPSNADSENDGTIATVRTAVAGSTTETMTSDVGVNVGSWSFTTCAYTGWFRMETEIGTSTCRLVAISSTAAFGDITMLSLSTLNGDENYLTTPFTYDLYAAGVDTLAKLQSLQIVHETTDAAAGVTPANLDVDAGKINLDGVF